MIGTSDDSVSDENEDMVHRNTVDTDNYKFGKSSKLISKVRPLIQKI